MIDVNACITRPDTNPEHLHIHCVSGDERVAAWYRQQPPRGTDEPGEKDSEQCRIKYYVDMQLHMGALLLCAP